MRSAPATILLLDVIETRESESEMENKTTHTPGPWHYVGSMISADNIEVARVLHRGANFKDQSVFAPIRMTETEANRALIAAAPELLNALKRLEQAITHPDKAEQFAAVEAARAAILRSEGSK